MIHDGCWEAYSLNSDDELVYDFKKDKRFDVFTAAGADVNSEAYKRQEGLYEAYRQQFNQEGWNIEKDNRYLEPILLEKQQVLSLLQNFVLDTMIKYSDAC